MMSLAASESAASEPLDEAMGKLAENCLLPLREKGVTRVAMTYLFHNGSKESPFSNFVKRKLTAHLLKAAARDIVLLDRQDFQIRHQEDSFGFTFSTGSGNLSNPESVDAILVGELIASPQARTIVICLKAIDPKTSRILSAPVINIELSENLATRLSISELDLPGLPPLPTALVDSPTWITDLSTAFDPGEVKCSLDDPAGTNGASTQNTRLLRAYLTSSLVSAGWTMLEREMFFLVAKDQSAVGGNLGGFPVGDVILRLQVDETAPADQPTCFAKAVQRKDGRLLGQSQITLNASAADVGTEKNIGGDQALAEALGRMQGKLRPSKEDPLVFSASVVLTDILKPSKDLTQFFKANRPHLFLLKENPAANSRSIGLWYNQGTLLEDIQSGADKRKITEETLIFLNALEGENLDAIKADLLSFLFWGYALRYDQEGEEKYFGHLGPLIEVVRQISSAYSLSRNGRDTTDEWLHIFQSEVNFQEGPYITSFVDYLLWSLHPKHREPFVPGGRTPLKYPTGSYKKKGNSEHPSILFDYKFETVWKETLPSTLKVTIDLTPMKNSIHKTRK